MSSAAPPCSPTALATADPALKAAVLGEALPYLPRLRDIAAMPRVISTGWRHPRESDAKAGGPERPLECWGPWIPAFAGMTANL